MKTTLHYKGHRWTQEELIALMAMWAEGKSPQEIADHLHATPFAVAKMVSKMRKNGIPLTRRRRGHPAGRSNTLWTQGEVEYLIRRRIERATADEIAVELGRNFSAIHGMVQKLQAELVQVPMYGNGMRRLWDANALRATFLGITPGDDRSEAFDAERKRVAG